MLDLHFLLGFVDLGLNILTIWRDSRDVFNFSNKSIILLIFPTDKHRYEVGQADSNIYAKINANAL